MPRKKIAKRVNKKAASIATAAQMEKDFSSMPAKLAIEINKELAALRKKETELKKAVAHTTTQLKATESRIKSVAKSKPSAAGKKQLAAAKKALQEAGKIHRSLIKELEIIAKSIASHIEKLARIKALSKAMAQFNKDWAKQAKTKKKSATKAKAKAKAKRKTKAAPQLKAVEKINEGSNIERLDHSLDNDTFENEEQPVEMAS